MRHRTLVTGGAGFIGSHLVDLFVEDGCEVTVIDDFSSGERSNLERALSTGRVKLVEGSILDPKALRCAFDGCDSVYHMAVQCVRRSLGHPIENHHVNATGTLMVLEQARLCKVRRFVYCSSSEIYGNCGGEWLSEETLPAPVTVYGGAKLAGEHYTKAYYQTYGLPATVVRPFNTYGPREHATGDLAEVIPRFVIRVLNGLPPVVFGSGDNGRDFTHVSDTVRGIAAAGECQALIGDEVNIAFGRMLTINEVALAVCEACGRTDIKPMHIDPRPGDVKNLQADTRKARTMLDYAARIDFSAGLRMYVDWFLANHPNPALLLEDKLENWDLPEAEADSQ